MAVLHPKTPRSVGFERKFWGFERKFLGLGAGGFERKKGGFERKSWTLFFQFFPPFQQQVQSVRASLSGKAQKNERVCRPDLRPFSSKIRKAANERTFETRGFDTAEIAKGKFRKNALQRARLKSHGKPHSARERLPTHSEIPSDDFLWSRKLNTVS